MPLATLPALQPLCLMAFLSIELECDGESAPDSKEDAEHARMTDPAGNSQRRSLRRSDASRCSPAGPQAVAGRRSPERISIEFDRRNGCGAALRC
jgi:hypothetical protein